MAAWILLGLIILLIALFEVLGWPFLAKPAERWLSETLERKVVLTQAEGEDPAFKLRLIGGIRLTLGNFELGAPAWSEAPYMVKGENVALKLNYSDLWAWRGESEEALRIDTLKADVLNAYFERLADGRASWQFAAKEPNAEPKPVPSFGLLEIKAGAVRYNDAPLDLKLNAVLSLLEGQADGDALKVIAQGEYQNKKLNIDLASTGVLPWVAQDLEPIPVDLNITLGSAKLAFKGESSDALKLQKLSGRFVVSGPSLASAGEALGITLPNTPPFRTEGELIRDADTWKANFANAAIGESKLKGDFVFEGGKDKPMLTGVLTGPSLVLADLGPTVGATGSKADETKNSSGRVLPDKPFDLPSLRAMDADVQINIDNLDLGSEILKPLRPLRAHLVLTDGVLRISEIDAKTAQGEMAGMVQLDGRKDIALWEMDLKWEGVQLEQWLAVPREGDQPPTSPAE